MKNLRILIAFICLFGCAENKRQRKINNSPDIEESTPNAFNLDNWINTPHVSERIATETDVKLGAAVFVIDSPGKEHAALAIEIPALAFHVDTETNEKKPGVVIQGEQVGDQKVIGIKYLDGSYGVCTLEELEFIERVSDFKHQ